MWCYKSIDTTQGKQPFSSIVGCRSDSSFVFTSTQSHAPNSSKRCLFSARQLLRGATFMIYKNGLPGKLTRPQKLQRGNCCRCATCKPLKHSTALRLYLDGDSPAESLMSWPVSRVRWHPSARSCCRESNNSCCCRRPIIDKPSSGAWTCCEHTDSATPNRWKLQQEERRQREP